MKKRRQEEVLSIIAANEVETQEELAEFLRAAGYPVTQATVSRDIRELRLTKITTGGGRQKYAPLSAAKNAGGTFNASALNTSAFSAECAGNLLVIKTRTGMGMAVATEIDEMNLPEILGTIGSDDVVFCAVRNPEQAERLKVFFLSIMNGGR